MPRAGGVGGGREGPGEGGGGGKIKIKNKNNGVLDFLIFFCPPPREGLEASSAFGL